MRIDLTDSQAKLLSVHLNRHIEHVENELVHTDKVQMQHDLAREVGLLREIQQRINAQIGQA
jgi:hypothetical protein